MGTYGLGVSIGGSFSPRSCSWRRGLVGRMPSRARTGDRADGELPLQDSNLDYLIQSRAQRVCLEDTMSVSGCPPSIGARRLGGQCPDQSGETLVKCLYRVLLDSPEQWSVKKRAQAFYKRF